MMSTNNDEETNTVIPVDHSRVTVIRTRILNDVPAICLNLQPNFCRRVKPLFFLSVLLLIGAFALFWNNEESNTFNFYLYKPTRSQVASFFTSSESNRSNQPKLKATTELIRGLTPKPVLNLTRYNKYMLTNVGGGACGGVGNVIFRIASLYGIGRHVRRNACLQGSCSEEYHIEIYSMFPNLHSFPLLTNCWNESQNVTGVGFAGNCWNYDDVTKLDSYSNHTFINLHTSYLQSHKFFHAIRSEILYMFDFSPSVKGLVDDYAKQMFDDDNSTKVCAHIRQGDFNGGHPLLSSTEAFTINAITYLAGDIILRNITDNVGAILFSDDIGFANNIVRQIQDKSLVNKAFVTRELNRVENIALAVRHCDYFVITSSGSTFGWWMAYLMPNNKQDKVYYNSLFFKKGNEGAAAEFHEEDFFPPEWNRLWLNRETGEITVQNRSKTPATVI